MLQRIIMLYQLLLLLPLAVTAQLTPIGQWRDHLPYHQAIQVTIANNKIWCATPYSLFSADPADNSLERLSKINGLHETGISAIGTDPTGRQLLVAYTNSQVDIVQNNHITGINAIKNTNITGDKTIYSIYSFNNSAYLCTGLGIIVLNLDKQEVQDTYIIGAGGNKIKVAAMAGNGNFFYAATSEGLKKAPRNAANLADFRNWLPVTPAEGLPAGEINGVVTLQQTVIAWKNDSLFMSSGSNWSFLYTGQWPVKNITVTDNALLVSEQQGTVGRIAVLRLSGIVEKTIQHPRYTAAPRQALLFNNEYWIADSLAGLSRYSGTVFEPYTPNSPAGIATGQLHMYPGGLYAAAGSVNDNWEGLNNKNGFYQFSNDVWTSVNATTLPVLDSLPDIIAIAADPVTGTVWAGAYGGGLAAVKANQVTVLKQNSFVQPAYFTPDSYRISGLCYDNDNNLWVANYGAHQPLLVRKNDGNWRSFSIPFPLAENAIARIVVDDGNQKWIVGPKGNGLICFNHGTTLENTADDRWKWLRAGVGNGNLPDNGVLCIAKDKNNFIWIGTLQGIGIIQCPQEIFTTNACEAVLPVVQQDNFAGYLFRNEQVQAIAVDGADRKWVGTRNGVWLINAAGDETIYHFTESNSLLVSNDVKQIAIDGKTGEVFFATDKGICSFRSTATEGTATNQDVLAFPNPVPPGYTGTIAIRGLVSNAIVKITELNGRLVYQTRALGGQATWNGRDYKGRNIATGIYLVLVSDELHAEKLVTKIVFINK